MSINWGLVKKRTDAIVPKIKDDVKAWLESHDNWKVDVINLNYPPRIILKAYRLSSVDARRAEARIYLFKQKIHVFVVERLRDSELDELTDLITPIVQDYNLQAANKKVYHGAVTYTLWLKMQPEYTRVPA